MRRASAALGSSVFFVLAPGVVAGLIPWWITGWHMQGPVWLRIPGALLLACGALVLVHAFVRFVAEGAGTPAPVAPPEHLVIGGLYRFVRNPMYVAVLAAILAQAMLLGSLPLLLYGAAGWVVMASFVRWYEEPDLTSRFGDEYTAYREAVPAWLPRPRPWKPTG